jgi:hypothetical protein
MKIQRASLIIMLLLLAVLLISWISPRESATEESKKISLQIEKIDGFILDNIKLTEKLKIHESRLKAVKINPRIYRIPLFIEGRSIYASADEMEIDDISYSLALEDLLQIHHAGKGIFHSDDPAVWKEIITKHSKVALDHLSNVELPAIQRRIDEIEKENMALESKKRKLLEEYKTLQGKV